MTDIIVLEGEALDWLINEIGARVTAGTPRRPAIVYRVRITYDGGGVKIKVNEGMWSPPLQSSEPEPGMDPED